MQIGKADDQGINVMVIKLLTGAPETKESVSSIAKSRERRARRELTLELVFEDIPRKVRSTHESTEA